MPATIFSSSFCYSFLILFIYSAFLIYVFCSISSSQIFFFFASGPLFVLFQRLFRGFFSLFWKIFFCLNFLKLFRHLFSLAYFANIFWFNSSSCTVSLICYCLFSNLFIIFRPCISILYFSFLSSFTFSPSFCIYPSRLLSISDFVFLFRFPWKIRILSLTTCINKLV